MAILDTITVQFDFCGSEYTLDELKQIVLDNNGDVSSAAIVAYDGGFLFYKRPLSDVEREKMRAAEARQKARDKRAKERQDAKDRALYEKLKKKFEDA